MIQKGLDGFNLAKFTSVGHCSLVLSISEFVKSYVVFENGFDDDRISIHWCNVQSSLLLVCKIKQICSFFKKNAKWTDIWTCSSIVNWLVVLLIHYIDIVVLLKKSSYDFFVWIYTSKVKRSYLASWVSFLCDWSSVVLFGKFIELQDVQMQLIESIIFLFDQRFHKPDQKFPVAGSCKRLKLVNEVLGITSQKLVVF